MQRCRRIDIINLTNKENQDTASMLNVALANIDFNFRKISEEELGVNLEVIDNSYLNQIYNNRILLSRIFRCIFFDIAVLKHYS